jgi:hypothetical protein
MNKNPKDDIDEWANKDRTSALEIVEKEDGTYLSICGKRYSAMILLGYSEMAKKLF